jgi:hypothetical protein
MTARRALALLAMASLSALVPACALPDGEPPRVSMEASYWLHGDTRFDREERTLIEAAVESWRRFTRGRVNLAIAWDLDERSFMEVRSEPRILKITSLDSRTGAVDASIRGRGLARGFQHGPRGEIPATIALVVDRLPELYPAVLHEIGHLVGLDELPPGMAGVMCSANPAWKFSRADWAACVELGICAGNQPSDPVSHLSSTIVR